MDKVLEFVPNHSSPAAASSQADHEPPPKKKGTYIRYRTEYRDRLTGEVVGRRDTEGTATDGGPYDETQHEEVDDDDPIFEITTTIKTRLRDTDSGGKVTATSLSKPRYHMNIYSAAIINALESVVRYYPSQSLGTDPVHVDWPYPVLVHHYDELTIFRDDAKEKGPDEACHLERQSIEHLTLLLTFLDHTVMPRVREEQERNKRGFVTWEYEWVSLRPGAVRLSLLHGEEDWHGQVIHSIKDGAFVDPPQPWTINSWSMDYDGQWLGRRISETVMDKFDGEVALEKSNIVLNEEHFKNNGENLPEPAKRKAEFGKPYLELLEKTCKYLKGPSRQFPYNEHDGLVMVDMKAFFEDNRYHKPLLMDQSDCRPTFADGSCVHCNNLDREKGNPGEKSLVGLYEEFNTLTPDDARIEGNLFLHLLCPIQVYVFALKTREWEPVHVQHLAEPIFEEGMINELVMDKGRKTTLTSLAKSFARRDKHGGEVSRPIWSADFVKGKGNGLIFLLHGRPGVGKTCTAECIAAFTRRPLMVLTPSDVGNTPGDVEVNLTKMFKRAVSWGAVLLVDEADVFMERRSTSDLARNSLVASFLRALENYDGILFLTTNRIGSFDDAFISRVHVQLYYPEFTDKEREMVWQTFIDKLKRDRGDHIRLHASAKEYISGKEMQAVEWNGREIRNALQTAVALAEYDAERGEDGVIIITDTHLKAIVDLSADFKKYLNSLHEGDESKRAERKFERLDDFDRKR